MDEKVDLAWIWYVLSLAFIAFAIGAILGYALTQSHYALIAALIFLTLSVIVLFIKSG